MHPAEQATRRWLEEFVMGHQLCPFAAKPFRADTIRYVVNDSKAYKAWTTAFLTELQHLFEYPRRLVETSLLILPEGPERFIDFLELIGHCEALIEEAHLVGEFQVAYFHPQFRFRDSLEADPGNRVGRSPVPVVHLLREDSVAEARMKFPDIEDIPDRNAEYLRELYRSNQSDTET